jgi:hypothetical protein
MSKRCIEQFPNFQAGLSKKVQSNGLFPPLLTYVVVYIANVFETSNTQNEIATSTSNSAVRKISLPTCDHYQTISTADLDLLSGNGWLNDNILDVLLWYSPFSLPHEKAAYMVRHIYTSHQNPQNITILPSQLLTFISCVFKSEITLIY